MPEPSARCALVFHAGALGDFVLTWPLLRALASSGRSPIVVAADSHIRLARRCLNIRGLSGERREATELWRECAAADLASDWASLIGDDRPDLVVSFVADEHSNGGRCWLANAHRAFPRAEVLCIGVPSTPTRAAAWTRFNVDPLGRVPPLSNAGGPIVLHVGAGARKKRWPFGHWCSLAELLRSDGHHITIIAGEVEREQANESEHTALFQLGGRALTQLDELVDTLQTARAFVGADTGPTHLAAQLGLPTIAIFGPTDPRVWAPVGPSVRVLAPASPCAMTWADPGTVRLGLNQLLAMTVAGPGSN